MSMRDQALNEALADQPSCTQDADCLLLTATVQCDGIVNLGDCGRPAHRAAYDRYLASKVTQRICEAVEGAEFGCGVQPLCIGGGTAACSAGQCVPAHK
jgi:hypothetical protein